MFYYLSILWISLMTIGVNAKFHIPHKISELTHSKGADNAGVHNVLHNLLTIAGKEKLDKSGVGALQQLLLSSPGDGLSESNGCECKNNNCGCCAHLKFKQIKLDDDLCANITYLPKDYGVWLRVELGKHVIINETFSAKNPPPLCVDVPELKKLASICIDLHDLDITNKTFKGCIALEARLAIVVKEKFELGCFTIPVKEQQMPESVHVGTDQMAREGPKSPQTDEVLRFKPVKVKGNF